jgi:hypothetical protein
MLCKRPQVLSYRYRVAGVGSELQMLRSRTPKKPSLKVLSFWLGAMSLQSHS